MRKELQSNGFHRLETGAAHPLETLLPGETKMVFRQGAISAENHGENALALFNSINLDRLFKLFLIRTGNSLQKTVILTDFF